MRIQIIGLVLSCKHFVTPEYLAVKDLEIFVVLCDSVSMGSIYRNITVR